MPSSSSSSSSSSSWGQAANDAAQTLIVSGAAMAGIWPGVEWVTYLSSGRAARRIRAIVQRFDENDHIGGFAAGARPAAVVICRNNADSGIGVKELDTGKDKIQIALRRGTMPVTVRLAAIIAQDRAYVRIKCQ